MTKLTLFMSPTHKQMKNAFLLNSFSVESNTVILVQAYILIDHCLPE